jgi:hypothetical protein
VAGRPDFLYVADAELRVTETMSERLLEMCGT